MNKNFDEKERNVGGLGGSEPSDTAGVPAQSSPSQWNYKYMNQLFPSQFYQLGQRRVSLPSTSRTMGYTEK